MSSGSKIAPRGLPNPRLGNTVNGFLERIERTTTRPARFLLADLNPLTTPPPANKEPYQKVR